MTITWCTVPEMSNVTDWIFLSFWAIFCSFTPLTTWKIKILKKWKTFLERSSFYACVPEMTMIWCMVPGIWITTGIFFLILDHYLPFYHPNKREIQNFEKMKKKKKMPEDTILHKCTINDNRMIYGSWDMKRDRQIFFGLFFALLPH